MLTSSSKAPPPTTTSGSSNSLEVTVIARFKFLSISSKKSLLAPLKVIVAAYDLPGFIIYANHSSPIYFNSNVFASPTWCG
mgnify:CR=1